MTSRHPLWTAGIAMLLAAGSCGCFHDKQLAPSGDRAIRAEDEARKLRAEVERLQGELAARDRRIEDLTAMGDKRLEKLYVVQRVRLGSATGGVDLDDKPGDDAVKVFLEPVDQHGSVLKAAGSVTVQLYDLAATADENLLAEHTYDVDETARHWSSGFVSYHYSFTCPLPAGRKVGPEVTVRVEFLDYLTGKTHTVQQLCKVATAPR